MNDNSFFHYAGKRIQVAVSYEKGAGGPKKRLAARAFLREKAQGKAPAPRRMIRRDGQDTGGIDGRLPGRWFLPGSRAYNIPGRGSAHERNGKRLSPAEKKACLR